MYQVCLFQFCEKFKKPEILLENLEDQVAETAIEHSEEDWRKFKNYPRSFIVIELVRYAKFKSVIELTDHPFVKEVMVEWALSEVLDDDEDLIYNEILAHLDKGQQWDEINDQEYYQMSIKLWEKQSSKAIERLNQELEEVKKKAKQTKVQGKEKGPTISKKNPPKPPEKEIVQIDTSKPIMHQREEESPHENLEELYHKKLEQKLEKFEDVKGAKSHRVEIMKNKILKESMLYDETQEAIDEHDEDFLEQEEEFDSDFEQRIGPNGEIYASESSGEELIEDEEGNLRPKRLFIPRCKVQAYKQGEGAVLKQRSKYPLKFTKGTDPKSMDLIKFLVDDSVACPQFLPLDVEDCQVTNTVIQASIHLPDVPLSEHIRKEAFYKSYQHFEQAILAEPALIKVEIQTGLRRLDKLYGIQKTDLEIKQDLRFTQGDYRRFCSYFYLVTRRWLKNSEFIMEREKKKRVMPRHLLVAAVLSNIIPLSHLPKDQISQEEIVRIERMLAVKRASAPRSRPPTRPPADTQKIQTIGLTRNLKQIGSLKQQPVKK